MGRDTQLIRPMRQPCFQPAGGWWGLRSPCSVLHADLTVPSALGPWQVRSGTPGRVHTLLCLAVHTSAGISVLRVHCKPICSAHPGLRSQHHLWAPELLVPKLPLSARSSLGDVKPGAPRRCGLALPPPPPRLHPVVLVGGRPRSVLPKDS